MSFLLDNFWKFLLIALLGAGGIQYYKKKQEDRAWESNLDRFALHTKELHATHVSAANIPNWEANYWRFLLRTEEARAKLANGTLQYPKKSSADVKGNTYDLRDYLLDSIGRSDYLSRVRDGRRYTDPVSHLVESTLENHGLLESAGVFADPAQRQALSTGKPPKAPSGIHAGEEFRLVRRVSPHLFRDGILDPINILVLPESASALYTPEVDESMRRFARQLALCGRMDALSLEAVEQLYREGEKRGQ